MPFGIYIHWPFCKSKCPYCDFFSKVQKNVPQDKLVNEYIDDIKYYATLTPKQKVSSVFFGGGTPSLLSPKNIERLLNCISQNWKLSTDIEISLEANPNTDSPNLFSDLSSAGINRLSLGIQSLRSEGLKFLGRTHDVKQALISAEKVLKIFNNNSADIIYALPNQSLLEWQEDVEQICSLGFKHLSLYQLTIEDGTFFAKKGIKAADDNTAINLYNLSSQILSQYRYNQYEVSNYAFSGYECKHNKIYWQGDDYIGIGPSAHGRIKIGNRFIATTYHRQAEDISTTEKAEELILMGLRLTEGIDKQKFFDICGIEFDKFVSPHIISNLSQNRLIENNKSSIKATKNGFLLLNKII